MEVEEESESTPEEMEGVGGPDVRRTERFFSFVPSFVFLARGEKGKGKSH